jgi:hypothetical protein
LLCAYRVRVPIPRELAEAIDGLSLPSDPLILPDEHHCWARVLHWLSWASEVMPAGRMTKGPMGKYGPADVPLDQWHLFSTDPPPRTFSSCLDNLYLRSVVALEWIIDRLESTPGDAVRARATRTAKGTPGTPERRSGQALTANEKKLYERIIRAARRLKLTPRMPGNVAKVADEAGVDREVAIKALRWGRRHGRV